MSQHYYDEDATGAPVDQRFFLYCAACAAGGLVAGAGLLTLAIWLGRATCS